ncbi:uncharacterized protein LOC115621729 [Scaptodrosophila lebanonensis]|uniref:Uncharacterized protein LOC115621729 n=1 Tax=Drosophila lebanonensis TaxID=7225 RepID=A0A6J2T860_DROLE|nr:uncharacterized protein LOC115621729 [Scaptodrosophila lebanonensis]
MHCNASVKLSWVALLLLILFKTGCTQMRRTITVPNRKGAELKQQSMMAALTANNDQLMPSFPKLTAIERRALAKICQKKGMRCRFAEECCSNVCLKLTRRCVH